MTEDRKAVEAQRQYREWRSAEIRRATEGLEWSTEHDMYIAQPRVKYVVSNSAEDALCDEHSGESYKDASVRFRLSCLEQGVREVVIA